MHFTVVKSADFLCLVIRIQQEIIIRHFICDQLVHIVDDPVVDAGHYTTGVGIVSGENNVRVIAGGEHDAVLFRHLGSGIAQPVHMDIGPLFHFLNTLAFVRVFNDSAIIDDPDIQFFFLFGQRKNQTI